MNCKNTNKEQGFDNFLESNYNLHWSFSNFNRMLMAAGQIARLPDKSLVLELGAGTSELEKLVHKNFKRKDINFLKVDGDNFYYKNESIMVYDITKETFWDKISSLTFNAIIFMEVIEHLDKNKAPFILDKIYKKLNPEGILILSTPTPPFNKKYESEVWPDDHTYEFSYNELYELVNKNFKITKEIGWSIEEREYNKLLETDIESLKIYSKLKNIFPESYIRALIACLSPIEINRQILFLCKKRRKPNGRLTSS